MRLSIPTIIALILAGAIVAGWTSERVLGAPPPDASGEFGPWFQQLKQPGSGISCCSIADCRQVEYRVSGGHYEALIQDQWMTVPDDKVLQRQDNPTGHAVVCYTPWQGILCFVSAAET